MIIFSFSQVAFSALTLTLQPLDYYNRGSEDYNGRCCDDIFCISDCDNWFKFCITFFPVSDFGKCRLFAVTSVLGDDNFNFPGYGRSLGRNVVSPLVVKFSEQWPVCNNLSSLKLSLKLKFSLNI